MASAVSVFNGLPGKRPIFKTPIYDIVLDGQKRVSCQLPLVCMGDLITAVFGYQKKIRANGTTRMEVGFS